MKRRVVIMGAAGRDFHNFNVGFRGDPSVEVVAFTATQIPYIADRRYPPELAGDGYPDGIPIHDESELSSIVETQEVDEVVFSYSDVSHEDVMHIASGALAAGADFRLMGPRSSMLDAKVPVVAVCAVRTGSGKSQTTRYVARILESLPKRIAVVRHPMPYGDLASQVSQRFGSAEDLELHNCTIEEREEYEPHLREGRVVYAGIDYQTILEAAQEDAEVLLWDGGNNDLPFFRPDLHIVVADPLRAGHETRYHPGETNLRMADVVVINKVDSADESQVAAVRESVARLNPGASVVEAESTVEVEEGEIGLAGKRVLVIEDGPTLTHGDMKYGAGVVAARRGGAEVVDPRPWAASSIRDVYETYDVGPVLPAMGYSRDQREDLEKTINTAEADLVLIATPIDLRKILDIEKPALRVSYELKEKGEPRLKGLIEEALDRAGD